MTVVGRRHRRSPYWQPQLRRHSRQTSTRTTRQQRLLELLVDATRIRLRADVPVGAYLSGGLDSTVITGLIKRYTSTPLRTFSVEFEDAEFDESAYQQAAREFLGTDHEAVRCSTADIGRDLSRRSSGTPRSRSCEQRRRRCSSCRDSCASAATRSC